jgi:uncharacterized protein DUF222
VPEDGRVDRSRIRQASVGDALGMLDRALSYLATADAASLPSVVQAEALRALARAEAKHTAARARVLGAFAGQGGFEDDGHASTLACVKWQTRVTHGSAVAAVAWARRLAAHPVIAAALAAGELSPSWARHLCDWTDRLPEAQRGDADEILAGAARAARIWLAWPGWPGRCTSGAARTAASVLRRTGSATGGSGWGSPSAAPAVPKAT